MSLSLMLCWTSMHLSHQMLYSSPNNSYGIVLRFTERGLAYAVNIAIYKEVPKWKWTEIINVSISNVNETADGVNYWIEKLILNTTPKEPKEGIPNSFSVTIDPTLRCLKVTALDAFASLRGKVQCHNLTGDEKQNCSVIVKTPWSFRVNIDRDKDGYLMSHMCNSTDKCAIPSSDPALYPTIEFSNCTRSEKKVCARGKSTFEELFIEHRLNETLNGLKKEACVLIEKFVNKNLTMLLRKKIDLIPNINKTFTIDLLMPKKPLYNESYIDTFHKGTVSWYTTDEIYKTTPISNYDLPYNNRMLYLWASGDTIKAFLEGFQIHGNLHQKITAEDLKNGGLNTTCQTGVCVGRLVPLLAEKYPNHYIDLDLYSLETPDVKFEQNLAVIKGKIVMFAYVRDPVQKHDIETIGIAKLNGKVSMQIKLWVNGSTLHAVVDAIDPYLENIDSSISDFNVQTVNFIIRSAVIVTVEPLLNEFGKTGFGIPVAHVELYNSTIELRKDIILIGSDLVHIEK